MGVYQKFIAPQEVREHLRLHAGRLTTYDLIVTEVESWLEEKAGDEVTPMDVNAAFTRGKKGDKAKNGGKPWWQGYGKTRKGGGAGAYANAKASTYFAGNCAYCGKWGHKKVDCWWMKQGGKKGDGKGGKKGKGGKGKNQKVESLKVGFFLVN
jgi:hypothetical protein